MEHFSEKARTVVNGANKFNFPELDIWKFIKASIFIQYTDLSLLQRYRTYLYDREVFKIFCSRKYKNSDRIVR